MAPCDRYRKLSKNLRHAPSAFCRQKSVVIDKMLELDLPACGLDLSSVTSACTPITYATKNSNLFQFQYNLKQCFPTLGLRPHVWSPRIQMWSP